MKRLVFFRTLLLLMFTTAGLSSCSSEENVTAPSPAATASVVRTPEVLAFQKALIAQIKSRSKTDFNKSETSPPMNLNENPGLVAAANNFLKASGFTQDELQTRTKGNGAEILSMALQAYAEQSKLNSNNKN